MIRLLMFEASYIDLTVALSVYTCSLKFISLGSFVISSGQLQLSVGNHTNKPQCIKSFKWQKIEELSSTQ